MDFTSFPPMTPALNTAPPRWDAEDGTECQRWNSLTAYTVASSASHTVFMHPQCWIRRLIHRVIHRVAPHLAPGGAAFSAGWRRIQRRVPLHSAPGAAAFSVG